MIPPRPGLFWLCRLAAPNAVLGLASGLAAADTGAVVVWEDNVTNTTAAGGGWRPG